MFRNVRLREIMASPAVTVNIQDSFKKVEEKFRMKGIRHLPVLDDAGRIVGLVTQRDLFRIAPPHPTEDGYVFDTTFLNGFILKYVMTRDPMTLGPDDSLAKAVEIMARNKYGCIPIVDSEKKILGIVTETDVLKFVSRNLI
ncbi:MAG: CBS domain-containing protein [Candidatus Omnitrophica bacterium]|nr:CBS domain-containing protein [Candidatus Omnitrophota bacterium]